MYERVAKVLTEIWVYVHMKVNFSSFLPFIFSSSFLRYDYSATAIL